MAATRRKLDEINIKTLRELGTLPCNKYCFDCKQRGPTYVNVTIGSFVCTKCSGMLRGLTPPHRVKSISMAAFTQEEIELLKNRGNDYCKKVWMGTWRQGELPSYMDDLTIKEFMCQKYERKQYYLDPSEALRNGYSKAEIKPTLPPVKPLKMLVSDPKPIRVNGTTENHRKRPEYNRTATNNVDFVADFDKADIFSSTNNNSNGISNNNNAVTTNGGFANFDNNPIFENTNGTKSDDFSIFDLRFDKCIGPVLNHVPLFPRCSINNRWSMPTPTVLNNINQQQNKTSGAPPEDKYAALKDLDNALKSQSTLDWSSSSSLYSSPTPTGSMYSSPSPQSSMFGSPSQGQFMTAFPAQENGVANPFNGVAAWQNNSNGVMGVQQQTYVNPFRPAESLKMNGFSHGLQQTTMFPVENGGSQWATANPFKVGPVMNMKSNNPFL